MKHKILGMLFAMMLCVTCVWNMDSSVQAEEIGEGIDFSYLMTENSLIGYSTTQTKGVYYSDGYSIINRISSSKIGAGGVTNANVKCKVSITSIVERQTSTGWTYVTSWTRTNENAFSAMISKSLTVGTGYWYRVRSSHYAASDASSSVAGALYM